jgi:sterol desaturase/sphingolipid hydroxylase (fatty acid hydroxylase superfamily)
MHSPWLFRRFHRVHHKSRTPTPWAAYAFAPTEAMLEAGILPLAGLFLPMHEITVLLFVTHMILRNVIGHAGIELFPSWWLNVPLLRAITTTTHHDLHHSHGGHNFGLYFTWWDRWMGTEHPEYGRRFTAVTQSASDIN